MAAADHRDGEVNTSQAFARRVITTEQRQRRTARPTTTAGSTQTTATPASSASGTGDGQVLSFEAARRRYSAPPAQGYRTPAKPRQRQTATPAICQPPTCEVPARSHTESGGVLTHGNSFRKVGVAKRGVGIFPREGVRVLC